MMFSVGEGITLNTVQVELDGKLTSTKWPHMLGTSGGPV